MNRVGRVAGWVWKSKDLKAFILHTSHNIITSNPSLPHISALILIRTGANMLPDFFCNGQASWSSSGRPNWHQGLLDHTDRFITRTLPVDRTLGRIIGLVQSWNFILFSPKCSRNSWCRSSLLPLGNFLRRQQPLLANGYQCCASTARFSTFNGKIGFVLVPASSKINQAWNPDCMRGLW